MMRLTVMLLAIGALGGCGVARHMAGVDQCMAPTEREAKITKRVWK